MKRKKIRPVSPEKLKTYSLLSRKSKVNIDQFALVFDPDKDFGHFLASIPNVLAGKDFKKLVSLMKEAKRKDRAIIFALGGHVIKVGLSPIIIDLMEKNWITGLALNGSGIIHDFEIAYAGHTSEEVEKQIKEGQFGMARETGEMLNKAINSGAEKGLGMGEAVGSMLANSDFPHLKLSLLWNAQRLGIPVTVHVAVGTDTIHFHPHVKGEAIGKTSLQDFFLFCALVEKLEGGGVYLNIGSAVMLPEVFLKALSFGRNRGKKIQDFTTAVFDFIHHYRPYQNVINRPLANKGKGFYFIGHHEFLIPLLSASLKA